MLRIERGAWLWRTTAVFVIAAQALLGVPVVARSLVSSDPNIAPPTPPPAAPSVKVNRTVPNVTPPSLEPRFSSAPGVGEITRARVFDEPLLPAGGTPTVEENSALGAALLAFHRSGDRDWHASIGAFLDAHPSSMWRASLLANIGTVESQAHRYAAALDMWDAAWALTSGAKDSASRNIADYAMAEWLTLAASFGQVDKVRQRLNRLAGRTLTGSASVKIARARENVALIEAFPDLSTLCGPQAIRALIEASGASNARGLSMLAKYRGELKGMSLLELQALAKHAGVLVNIVERIDAEDVPVPSIVHWRIGHYATVVERAGQRYRIVDRARHDSYWVDRDTLFSESSGYFLIWGERAPPTGWRAVRPEVAVSIVGSGPLCDDGAAPRRPPPDPPCPKKDKGPDDSPGFGMCGYQFQPVTASLLLHDTPIGYSPPRGPGVPFTVAYHQRDDTQPQLFTYANLGPKWALNWIRFVKEEPTDGLGVTPPHVWVLLPPGGEEAFVNPNGQGVFSPHWHSRAVLVHSSDSPVRYERRLPDGTVEVYAFSDGAAPGSRRVFLTQIVDPQGQSISLTWDAQCRLVGVADALGQVSTIEYGVASDPLKVSRITDPFGRQSTFSYNGAGQLETITDVIGLTSRFSYSDDDFVSKLTTPYGSTSFRSETPALNSSYTMRFIEATDPLGGTEHLEFQYQTPSLDAAAPTVEVPTEFSAWNTTLDHFNTFYWDKRAWATGPGDLAKATITHWLQAPEFDGWQIYAAPVPHSVKRPLERRVWYAYSGQTSQSAATDMLGWWTLPVTIGRVLDDGSSQIWRATFNDQGHVLTEIDPLGRQTTYTYDGNGIDLLSVRQTTGGANDVLATYANYTSGHRPQTILDAASRATTLTYNSAGQVLTITNPRQETTTFGYDGSGHLTSMTGALTGSASTFVDDDYGRVRTVTGPDGYAVTFDYDAMDRPIRTTRPDGTYEETTYDRLDAAASRDRLGRVTRYYHDALRHLIGVRDALGRTVTLRWANGSLDAIVDAQGHSTSWQRDLEGRVTAEIRQDGSAEHYVYATANSRLLQRTDAKSQVTTYAYAADGALTGISYTNATNATSALTFSYDTAYSRLIGRSDGAGTTTYTYRAVGTLGAGQVSAVDGPLDNDTVVYSYDELGRVSSWTLGNTTETTTFDQLGRLIALVDPIGTFTWSYDGATSRVAQITYPNGQTSSYAYFGHTGDHRLQTIHHQTSGGATLSKFDYSYDPGGEITTWTQKYQATTRAYDFTYDSAGQLAGAFYRTTDSTPTMLVRRLYRYDTAGNRTTAQTDDAPLVWTHNAMNEATAQGGSALLQFEGTLNEAGTVTIAGKPANVDAGGAFVGSAPVANGTNTVSITARDVNGNTTTQAYEVDVTDVTGTFTYDADGNLTAHGTRTYVWNAENRLVRVTEGGSELASFTYDGLGRRVSKTAGGVTHRYVYERDDIIEDRIDGGPTSRFVHGPGIDQHLASLDGAGSASYYLADHLGSIVQATDASQQVTLTRQYDPWGTLTAGGATSGYAFTGREWDAEIGLYYYRARYYDPALGRFISVDPLGGPRPYGYVGNDPTGHLDPTGLYPTTLHYRDTFNLAIRAGFSAAQASAIALANAQVDIDQNTAWYNPFTNGFFHFSTAAERQQMLDLANQTGSLGDLGRYLHMEQDSFSHQTGTKDRTGTPYQGPLGHLGVSPDPDAPEERPDLYKKMLDDTYEILKKFYRDHCAQLGGGG